MTHVSADAKLQEWAKYFKLVGSPVRLLIVLALYGSEVLRRTPKSLTFSEIKAISGVPSDETLVYHLKQLEETSFIAKDAYKDEKSGRVYPLYHIGERGRRFLLDLGLTDLLSELLKRMETQMDKGI